MTRLYISADIEGMTGVVSPRQCAPEPDAEAYRAAVQQMGLEVSRVAEAALAMDVAEIVVNDSHMSMTNLTLAHLPDRVKLLSGKPKPVAMSAGLDKRFNAAMYIGYHAKAGTAQSVLCHTFHNRIYDVSVNGRSYGEGGINALYASLVHQVPVILASGDAAFCEEIRSLIPDIATVETKTALGFAAALNRPVADVLAEYHAKTQKALADPARWERCLPKLKPPYELTLTLINTVCADTVALIPGWTRLDGTRLSYETQDFHTLYLALQSAYAILAYAALFEG